jgi:hypothetical protein
MENRKVWGICLAMIVSAGGAGGQQSATPPKTIEARSTSAATSAQMPAADSAQKVVLKVGSTQITESEIDAVVSRLGVKAKAIVSVQGLRPVAEDYTKMLLLSQRASDERLDLTPDIRFQLQLQRVETLAQAEYDKMAGELQISQEEISQYFTAHRPEFETVQVQEFLIRKRPQGTEDPKQGLTPEEARSTAESIRKALLSGTAVEEVAKTFDTSISVMLVDQRPRTLRRAEMKPILQKATFDLPDGGVSEIVDTAQALIVVKVFAHQHPELKEVTAEIRNKVQQQKLDAEVDAMKKKAGVWMDQEYFKPLVTSSSASQPTSLPPRPQP